MSDFETNQAPSTPTGGDTPAPVAPAIQGTPAVAPTAIPNVAPQTPATGAPDVEPSWLRGRLNEVRQAAIRQAQTEFATERQRINDELNRYRTQVQALVGVTPQGDPQQDAIKQQFFKLFPEAKEVFEQADKLKMLAGQASNFEAQQSHYWESHSRNTMDRLFTKANETLGSPLTDEGKSVLHSAFVGYVQSSPERIERYSNDPSLVDDFWRAYSSNLIDPARRSAASQTINRAPGSLPQDTPGGVPVASRAQTFNSLDERVASAWSQYNQKV